MKKAAAVSRAAHKRKSPGTLARAGAIKNRPKAVDGQGMVANLGRTFPPQRVMSRFQVGMSS
jgi:hypothetical protein